MPTTEGVRNKGGGFFCPQESLPPSKRLGFLIFPPRVFILFYFNLGKCGRAHKPQCQAPKRQNNLQKQRCAEERNKNTAHNSADKRYTNTVTARQIGCCSAQFNYQTCLFCVASFFASTKDTKKTSLIFRLLT